MINIAMIDNDFYSKLSDKNALYRTADKGECLPLSTQVHSQLKSQDWETQAGLYILFEDASEK